MQYCGYLPDCTVQSKGKISENLEVNDTAYKSKESSLQSDLKGKLLWRLREQVPAIKTQAQFTYTLSAEVCVANKHHLHIKIKVVYFSC